MVESRDEKTGGRDNPYELNLDGAFATDDGHQNADSGDGGEISFIDPLAAVPRTDNSNGNTGDTSGISAANTGTAGNASGERTKRKYTRRGSKANEAVHLGGWEDAIQAIHLALSGITKCPELELDEGEARKVTMALDRLAGHYDMVPSETAKVWINFAGAIGSVYGSRAIAIKARLDTDKAQKGARPTLNFANATSRGI